MGQIGASLDSVFLKVRRLRGLGAAAARGALRWKLSHAPTRCVSVCALGSSQTRKELGCVASKSHPSGRT